MTQKQLRSLMILFIVPYSAFIQIIILPLLPKKFFNDANLILKSISGTASLEPNSFYQFCSNFFGSVGKALHIESFTQWAAVISSIFIIWFLISILKYTEVTVFQVLFVYMSLALLNIYVFRIGKDIIQLVMNIACYYILNSKLMNNRIKIALTTLLLVIQSVFFRSYFILVAVYFLTLILYIGFKQNYTSIGIVGKLLVLLLCSTVALLLLKKYEPALFHYLTMCRDILNTGRLGGAEAKTIVLNVFPMRSASVPLFILNYATNSIRFLFPLELIRLSIYYIPFIVYQLIVSVLVIKKLIAYCKDACLRLENQYLLLIFVVSYLLVSFIFEPDFGSFVRHECVLTPMIFSILMKEKKMRLLL